MEAYGSYFYACTTSLMLIKFKKFLAFLVPTLECINKLHEDETLIKKLRKSKFV